MYRSKNWVTSIIFLSVDILLLYAIFQTAYRIRIFWLGPGITWKVITPLFQLGLLFCLAMFFLQGLYPGYGLTTAKELERISKAVFFSFFLLASIAYLYKPFQVFSRSIVLIAWGLSLIFLPLTHFLLRNILSRTSWYGMPVVIFGNYPWSNQVADSLRKVRRLGWKPIAIHPLEKAGEKREQECGVQMAILAPSEDLPVGNLARSLNQRYRSVLLLRQNDYFGSLWVEPRDLEGKLGLEFHYHLLTRRNRWIKQAMDWLGSALLLLLLSPVLALIAFLVHWDSPGPIFFQQKRLGKNFRHFPMLKFRTMVVDAETHLKELLKTDEDARIEYETYHKLANDPRITRVGRWLRKFSLDELPQIINVVRGEMSLVGPRAYMLSELDDIGEYAPIILRVKPGMTGWWQVLGRHNTSFQKHLEMDEYYISNWSLWMDIYILLKTVQVVLQGNGA